MERGRLASGAKPCKKVKLGGKNILRNDSLLGVRCGWDVGGHAV